MITIFSKPTHKEQLQELATYAKDTWVYVEAPTGKELQDLASEFNLDRDYLNDAIDIHEVPRIENSENATYIFTRFVHIAGNGQIKTAPMLLILLPDILMTVSHLPFPPISVILDANSSYTTKDRGKLVAGIFYQINDTYNDYLNIIGKKIGSLSVNIEKIRNKDIVEFVQYENILNNLDFALIRMNAIYILLLTGKTVHFTREEMQEIKDIHRDNEQFIQITKESLQSIGSIRQAYSTIMTNNLNKVIKLFTSLTVVLTIPTIIGTFYGMNVALPFAKSPDAFVTIISLSIGAALIAIILFLHKDWL
jgi:magnesium transporter